MKNKNKKGFTLVELIIVVALMAILGVAVVSMMAPASNLLTDMQQQQKVKMVASGIMQVIVPQARFGTDLTLKSSMTSGDGNRYIYMKNNRVYTRKENQSNSSEYDLMGAKFYNNCNVTALSWSIPAANTVMITVTVTSAADNTISSTQTTTVQNMNSSSGVSGSGAYLCFKWLTQPSVSP